MKTGAFICLVGVIVLVIAGIGEIRAGYRYENEIGSYWSLADKASTIDQKASYIDKFVAALDRQDLSGNNAIIYPTPNNSVSANVDAIRTLQSRLHQIKTMDPRSFEYQTAIGQITQQEQGEAHEVIGTIEGGWRLHNGYWYAWEWLQACVILAGVVLACGGVCWFFFQAPY